MTRQRYLVSDEARSIILVGFIGSFTTFSAFLFETDQFLERSQWFLASLNVAGELVAGLIAFIMGASLGRLI
jgi:CrcB protein